LRTKDSALFINSTNNIEEYDQQLNKIENPTKCEVMRTSQETLLFADYLGWILDFVRFLAVSF